LAIRSRAFSANSGQFEAGSTTTGSSLRPSTPPASFSSSMAIRATSFSEVSLMAMVPDSECRMPTLMGPVSEASAWAGAGAVAVPGAGADSFFSQAPSRAVVPMAHAPRARALARIPPPRRARP
jgi:hypothetical protein